MKTGPDLIREIDRTVVEPHSLALWWLGQQSFIVKGGNTVIYLDPFLTPMGGRQVPPLLRPEEAVNAAAVCGTHDHADHIDRPAWPGIAAASPQAVFVLPAAVETDVQRDVKLDPRRMIGLDAGQSATVGEAIISAVPAAHEFLDQDPKTGRYPYLGYVVTLNGCSLYHAGDTCLYEGIHGWLRRTPLDVMILPINGRDAKRLEANCIGNMTYQEAADLAGALRPGSVIPAHYDMFAMNPGDVKAFDRYMLVKYPRQKVVICRHGERTVLATT
jgi:L-ascorbate metabolism protein UlaG (beta-lactamase superfamily)